MKVKDIKIISNDFVPGFDIYKCEVDGVRLESYIVQCRGPTDMEQTAHNIANFFLQALKDNGYTYN